MATAANDEPKNQVAGTQKMISAKADQKGGARLCEER
jgi:hypothetical protein